MNANANARAVSETQLAEEFTHLLHAMGINTDGAEFFETSTETMVEVMIEAYRAGLGAAHTNGITKVVGSWQPKILDVEGFTTIGSPQESRAAALAVAENYIKAHRLECAQAYAFPTC